MTCTGFENRCFCSNCCDRANAEETATPKISTIVPFVDVWNISEYGLTQKLQIAVRVF